MNGERQRRASGSVQPLGPGKWRVWVSGGRDAGGRRIRVSEVVHSAQRKDAAARLRALTSEIDRGEFVPGDRMTVRQFLERWWPSKAASLSPTGAVGLRRMYDKYMLPRIGGRPLHQVTAPDVAGLVGLLVNQGKVGQAIHVHQALRVLFNAAQRQGVIVRSPVAGTERPQKQHREMRTLTPDDWRRVHGYLLQRESWAIVPFTVLLTCGIRRSELAGLRWGDIDLARSVLHVRRSYHLLKGGKVEVRSPKTARARRAVAVDSWTAASLATHLQQATRDAEMLGRRLSDNDYVFCRGDGTPWPPDTFSQLWRRTVAKLGIVCRLHDLRHSAASLMLASGADAKLISVRLGHSSVAFTLDTYAHLLPDAQARAAERMAAMLNAHAPALPAPRARAGSSGGDQRELAHELAHVAAGAG